MLSLVHMPLASLDNGCTAAVPRLVQLQTDTQRIGVHHVPHSEACDAGSPKTPTAHRVFEMPLEIVGFCILSEYCEKCTNCQSDGQNMRCEHMPNVPKGSHPIAIYPNTPLNGHSRTPIP